MHMQRCDSCFVYGMADDDDADDDDGGAHVNGLACCLFTGAHIAKHGMQYGTHDAVTIVIWCCRMPIWWCIFIAQCGLWLRFTVFTMSNVDGDINIYVVYCSFNFICCRFFVSSWVMFVLVKFSPLDLCDFMTSNFRFYYGFCVLLLCPEFSMPQYSTQNDERRWISGIYWKNAIIQMDLLLHIYDRTSIPGHHHHFLVANIFSLIRIWHK